MFNTAKSCSAVSRAKSFEWSSCAADIASNFLLVHLARPAANRWTGQFALSLGLYDPTFLMNDSRPSRIYLFWNVIALRKCWPPRIDRQGRHFFGLFELFEIFNPSFLQLLERIGPWFFGLFFPFAAQGQPGDIF